jgi:Methyltransferase domain
MKPPSPLKKRFERFPFRSRIGAWLHGRRVEKARRRCLELELGYPSEIKREEWESSLSDPTRFYLRCFQFFHRHLPQPLQDHRAYFSEEGRGFGEDAFHMMWFLLAREFRPTHFLEIGVYRGQVLSLVSLLQRMFEVGGQVEGISPFLPAGDSVSQYRPDIDYLRDTLHHMERFSLPPPILLKAFSTDPAARERIASRLWDLIYIDGNHDEEVVRADWQLCSAQVRPGGAIVLDDSGLTTSFEPPAFATKGHPGPSRIAQEIDRSKFREILQVGHNRVFQRLSA